MGDWLILEQNYVFMLIFMMVHQEHELHVCMLHLIILVCNSKDLYTDIFQTGTK